MCARGKPGDEARGRCNYVDEVEEGDGGCDVRRWRRVMVDVM